MPSTLVPYLAQRPDAATFLLPLDLGKAIDELFGQHEMLLPQPYKIFPADETQRPILGFPLEEVSVIKDLEARLDRWLQEEIAWQVGRKPEGKEKAQTAFQQYLTHLMRVAENALMSNLLNDYHAVFWLAHSMDLARHFSAIPRRVSSHDTQVGRTQGDSLKYRIYAKWAADTREQMTQLAARAASILDGEEQRGLQFFRLLQDDVLIFTEEFVGPDLREIRSFIHGYLRRDFQSFRDTFERLRAIATDLTQKDKTFHSALVLFGVAADQGVTLALLLDPRFQNFFFEQPSVQNGVTREDREQFQLIARRIREFAVLNQLRRGIIWMATQPDGRVVSSDKRYSAIYSKSTRPMDFGRAGVVDPMVHRFGLIYDITAFSETLGNLRRGGGKEEIRSYRQMLLFQRKVETVAQRHLLQFEKFLGDGAFYTTRRALRLLRSAVEIQRLYSDMKRKGFAFNKGLRIALNYGYYRLLPMKVSVTSNERITEFYGPGIVELSRLTTGKANKEIAEIASFLIARGYDPSKVQSFFAPLSGGTDDVIDKTQEAREFYAYVNANGNLINEGLIVSMAFLQELSGELAHEAQPLFRLRSSAGSFIGFSPAIPDLEYIGLRLLGMVPLKGIDNVEVGEVVPFTAGEVEATPLDPSESFVTALRQEFHRDEDAPETLHPIDSETHESEILSEVVICVSASGIDDEVVIGEWDPRSDDVKRPLRMPRGDFQRLFSLKGELTADLLSGKQESVRELYNRLSERTTTPNFALAAFRDDNHYDAFLLGDVVEKL